MQKGVGEKVDVLFGWDLYYIVCSSVCKVGGVGDWVRTSGVHVARRATVAKGAADDCSRYFAKG